MKETERLESGVILRPWREEDSEPVEDMIRKTWWESDGISPSMQERISTCFLMDTLRSQTFVRVAEWEGRPVGVIMGEDLRHRHSTLTENWRLLVSALGIVMTHEGRRLLHEMGGEALNHRELDEKGGNIAYDGEVVFFMVDDTLRGKGIGKALYGALMDYFEECGVKTWRVYTDTDCSYGFYEHEGAVRRSEIHQKYGLGNGEEGEITYFLYDHGI